MGENILYHMGRRCSICTHTEIEDINRHLIYGTLTHAEISRIYGVSKYAIKRHAANHLQPIIEEAAQQVKEQAKEDTIATLTAVDRVINEKFEELLMGTNPSYSQMLDYIKFRSQLLGETTGPTQVNIEWGPTIQEDGSALSEPEGLTDSDINEIEAMARRGQTE